MWSFGSNSNSNSDSNSDSNDHVDLTAIVRGCATSNHTDYGSHEPDTWIFLQEAHDRVKGRYARNWHENGHSLAARGGREKIPHTGMQVPFEVRTNPKNGLRQLAVTRDIPEGFTLWEPIHYATFRNEHEYLEFLEELPHHLRCDALSWTHASYMDSEAFVDITLDEGTFIHESSIKGDININLDCVALREIKAGEFIYSNHTDYLPPSSASSKASSPSASMPHKEIGVEWFDDIRSLAWKRTGLGMGRSGHHQHRHQHQNDSILPGMLALSTLCYFAAKFLRTKQNNTSSFHNHYSSSSNNGSSNGNSYTNGLASFFSNAQKNKLA